MCQIYVDDIIFGSTNQEFGEEFGKMMTKEFEMSMIRELSYFIGLQIKKLKSDTFVSQAKYINNMLNMFGMEDVKPIRTPMAANGHLDLNENGEPVDQKVTYWSMMEAYSLLIDRISYLLYAYVQGFKPHLRNVT